MTKTLERTEIHQSNKTLTQVTLAFALIGIAVVHIMDLPDKWTEVRYLGIAYVGLIAAATYLAARVISNPKPNEVLASLGLAASVIAGFVINRTVGMPLAMDDIGNWWEPLGLVSLYIEGIAVYLAAKLLLNSK